MDFPAISFLALLTFAAWLACKQAGGFEESAYKRETGRSFWNTIKDKGALGEYRIGVDLETAFPGGKLLFNVYVPKRNGETSEIDVLLITSRRIYVIESKNYSGLIFGDEADRYWTAVLNKNTKNRFYSPILQNDSHVRWLCRYLGVSEGIAQSVVVFGDGCDLRKVPVSTTVPVVKHRGLVSTIRKMESESRESISHAAQEAIYERLRPRCNLSEAARKRRVDGVRPQSGQPK